LIIFRYICREILSSTVAVSVVLLLILMSGRFVKYLANAVAGEMESGAIFALIGYRIPGFLELVLPLAFFLAVLLTFGRLYVENEMSVLKACGISERRLMGYTLVLATCLALMTGWLSLSVAPAGMAKADILLKAQKSRSDLDKLMPKKFYTMSGGRGVAYTESVSESRELEDIFLAMTSGNSSNSDRRLVLVLADTGQQQTEGSLDRYLVLNKGYRIEGVPGQHDYQITHFEEYGSRLESKRPDTRVKMETVPTSLLVATDDLKSKAMLQWRLSIPLLVLVVTVLAVPLSRTDHRKGRFGKLLPAIVLYFTYLVALNAMREALESGSIPMAVTILPVHLLYLAIAIGLLLTGQPKKSKTLMTADEQVV
jgi:lipopolysaccharide export system permease protein